MVPYQTEERTNFYTGVQTQSQVSAFLSKVYAYMAGALAVTGLVAYYTSISETMVQAIFGNQILFYGLILAELGLVFFLSARINKLSYPAAAFTFIIYSILNGLTLSVIFLAYDMNIISTTFFTTAGTFAAMSLIGYFTKTDLSKMGSILRMALVGIIIASIVNFFVHSSMLFWVINYIGVLVFVGLTAYDTQKIKNIAAQMDINTDSGKKVALLGALTLYLDFINLFLFLLRILASRD